MSDSATPWTSVHQASLSFTISWSSCKCMSIELMMPSNHFTLCCPLLLLPSIFPSISIISSKLALCIRWPKYWSFSFRINPSSEYSGLISFRTDWFDLLSVQETLKSLRQYHNYQCSGAYNSYGPNLTSTKDYWKTDSFDYTDFCWQSDVSAF